MTGACKKAYELIDLNQHEGGHPRLGSVDLVPIHPISPSISLKECGLIAKGTRFDLSTTELIFRHDMGKNEPCVMTH